MAARIEFMGLQERGFSPGSDATLSYIFKINDKNVTEVDIYQHFACPKIWDAHPRLNYRIKPGGIKFQQNSKPWSHIVVTCTYSVLTAEEKKELQRAQESGTEKDPEKQPTEDQPDWTIRVSEVWEDVQVLNKQLRWYNPNLGQWVDAPFCNSALEPYAVPPAVTRQEHVVTIRRNLPIDHTLWERLRPISGTVNNALFREKINHVVLNPRAKAGRVTYQTGENEFWTDKFGRTRNYAELQVTWRTKAEGSWELYLVDQGSYELDFRDTSHENRVRDNVWTTTEKKKPFVTKGRGYIQLLDGHGQALSDGAEPVYNKYEPYVYADHKAFLKKLLTPLKGQ